MLSVFDLIYWFVLVLWYDAFVVIVLSYEPRQNQGRGLVDRKLVKGPSDFIAGRPEAALQFLFLGDFSYGVPLFIVILVIYKYKDR